MGRIQHGDGRRRAGRVCALVLAGGVAGAAGQARADEPEPPVDGATLIRTEGNAGPVALRPWLGLEWRVGRELTWARWMMAGDALGSDTPRGDDETREEAPWLDLAAFRGDLMLQRPEAGASAVSAVASTLFAGLPMLGVWRDGKLRQRHVLRSYFRGRGVAIAWRIEF